MFFLTATKMMTVKSLFLKLTIKFWCCFLFVLLFIIQQTSAQNFISAGPTISSGSSSFPYNGKLGIGGSVVFVHNISTHGGLRLLVGYDYFKNRFPKNGSQDSLISLEKKGMGTSTFLPVRVGYQHFLFKDLTFLYAEAGVSIYHLPTLNDYSNLTKSLFTYSVGLGQRLNLSPKDVIQLSVFYNYNRLYKNRNLNYFSIRAAYGLTFGKKHTTADAK